MFYLKTHLMHKREQIALCELLDRENVATMESWVRDEVRKGLLCTRQANRSSANSNGGIGWCRTRSRGW